jgi:hypothetical protein
MQAVKSLYSNFECAVRVCGNLTDWFPVNGGVKQGCLLSPILFALYVNTLAEDIKSLGLGINVGDQKTSILLYADDIVLLASSPEDLQCMLDTLNDWCHRWRMTVNPSKTQIVHFHHSSISRSNAVFHCGDNNLETVAGYKYLGLYFEETLNWQKSVKNLADSANRALGAIICKSKLFGGLPYQAFSQLFESVVRPILEYGTHIWGHCEYKAINSVYHKAGRYFMCVGKYTPNLASQGDMGWCPPKISQAKQMLRYWHKLSRMGNERLPKQCFYMLKCQNKGWLKHLKRILEENELPYMLNEEFIKLMNCKKMLTIYETAACVKFNETWSQMVNNDRRQHELQKNKLRTYRLFKTTICPEPYLTNNLSRVHRRAMAQFRCGVAPLRIETDRYSRQRYIPEKERICLQCDLNEVESELHVITRCPVYSDIRICLYDYAETISENFITLSDIEKFIFIFSAPGMVKKTAKTCFEVLQKRRDLSAILNQ